MSEKRELPEEEEQGAPMYMLSFGDMMTNLLCFFILLCAFSEERRAGFISDGVASFRAALMSHGLPGVLSGDRKPMDLGADRVLFRPAKSISPRLLVDAEGRMTDANRNALREVLIRTLQARGTREIPAPLVFSPGSAELTSGHKTYLAEVASAVRGGKDVVRVEGFAWKEGLGSVEERSLAFRRARNALRYMASVGDIPMGRFEPVGYGPDRTFGSAGESERQKRWGRRVVLLSLVGKRGQ